MVISVHNTKVSLGVVVEGLSFFAVTVKHLKSN